jgi:hypothetical protein
MVYNNCSEWALINYKWKCMQYSHPIVVVSSAWLQIRLGAMTMAIFWGVILFTSWLRDSAARNFIRYRKLSKFACGSLSTTCFSACWRTSFDDWILKINEKILLVIYFINEHCVPLGTSSSTWTTHCLPLKLCYGKALIALGEKYT